MKQYLIILIIASVHTLPLGAQKPFQPGEVVTKEHLSSVGEDAFFGHTAIPDTIFALMQGKTYKANCPIKREDLRYLLCLHCDIEGRIWVGEMVVNKQIADAVLDILHQLYKAQYPIERMRLMDYWNADDEASMRDNNSSGFNFRNVTNTNTVSKHGKGLAVDINPRYNPYYKKYKNGKIVIEPQNGKAYLDRSKSFPYKIEKGDLCYRLFKQHGFRWGGEWISCKDYQHFEFP